MKRAALIAVMVLAMVAFTVVVWMRAESKHAVEDTQQRIEDIRITNPLVVACTTEAGYSVERCGEWAMRVISDHREVVLQCWNEYANDSQSYWACVTAAGFSPQE